MFIHRRKIPLKRAFGIVLPVFFAALLFSSYFYTQTTPGDETPEETLSRSSRNLHQWGALSSFHGLPSEKVRAITQTPDGYVWFGTDSGLAKFDGRRVQTNVYSNLASVSIFTLAASDDGTLWIGSEQGAFYMKDGDFHPIESTSDKSITSIQPDDKSAVLTGEDGEVYSCGLVPSGYKCEQVADEKNAIQAVVRYSTEYIFGTHGDGLVRIENGKAVPIPVRPKPFYVNVIKRAPNGSYLIGTRSKSGSGLFVTKDFQTMSILGDGLGTINAIDFDSEGRAWVGTDERGLFVFEEGEESKRYSFASTSGSLRSDQILSVFVDRENVVWIGTDEGVNRFDPLSPRNERVSDNTQSNFVRVVARRPGGGVIAGTNRGLYVSQGEGKGWTNVVPDRMVFAIQQWDDTTWFFGSPSGLYRYSEKGGGASNRLEGVDVRSLALFRGRLYAGTYGSGLFDTESDEPKKLLSGNIVSLYAEGDERLWIGTTEGVVRTFDGKGFSDPISLPDVEKPAIWAITGNSKDGIWLSTNKGLLMIKDGAVQSLLPTYNIRQTVLARSAKDELLVWCAAEEGLFSLIFEPNFGWISSRSDIEQGFASENMFSLAESGPDSLVVATNRGIVRKDISQTPPLLAVTKILSQRLHDTSELKSGISLEYPQNSLTVEVTALSSRTFPEEFQYSFLLFDSDGQIIKKRFTDKEEFLMENLGAGTYKAQIRAYDRNLSISEPLVFQVKVPEAPFPWIATTLAVLLIIALAALIWAIVTQRQIFRTSRELEVANTELNSARLSLANEAERERHRIARDLHDQTLADLRHLMLMADDVPNDKALEFRSEIEDISDEIRRICEDLSPSVLENIGFTAALEWELSNSVEQASGVQTSFHAEDDLDDNLNLSRAEQIQVYRIAQEVLTNIVRHAEPKNIDLDVRRGDEKNLRLSITDDGKSFDPRKRRNKKGRGVTNIMARAQLIEAEVKWTPKDKGTEFTLAK
ncbi:MAG: two-component regulator propeller domain-containing protein [Pyrinomonadaceae bacterium]